MLHLARRRLEVLVHQLMPGLRYSFTALESLPIIKHVNPETEDAPGRPTSKPSDAHFRGLGH